MRTCQECGLPVEKCSDPEFVGYPQRTVCYSTMQHRAAEARYDALHEEQPYHDGTFTRWSKDRTDAYPFHFRDGVTIWMSETDETPDDDFLGQG